MVHALETPKSGLGSENRYRLVTRSDFDGLVCATLLRELNLIEEIFFTHPKDMQDGKIEIGEGDITTNLPYVPGVHLAFDHHHSETVRIGKRDNHIIDAHAPSAARVVWNHYGQEKAFPRIDPLMMEAVDKCDAAQLNQDDVINPDGWMLLNYIMDARSGLGRFKEFRISNYDLMMELIEMCRNKPVLEILEEPDVKERVEVYLSSQEKCIDQLKRCATVDGNLVRIDLRDEEVIWPGNRFLVYTLFPDCNISMHILPGREPGITVFAIGKSIFNRSSNTNVGELCLAFHGGGHAAAGTCQVPNAQAEKTGMALAARIKLDG
ncbi:exopolyphosphatase [Aestuariispira insulae]|uniref:NanoRNase/pAp phosphatase (C-di-AMP/oligoRNAs hydrolase) n=1 Tax=Aestuariispira insulae TaxID=1461337 RepID=A0A3D9HJW6_9PROT|nr:exopolyphosphatase [Aestuariispira insulae]RED49216.1 nanoRNase/pAp phosphatase (c-di-AMP/oligoRNAs hydrolase) [Aestuariispira insulae]